MGLNYQRTDRKVLDYDLWYLPDVGHPLRGPRRWAEGRPYVAFVGAAQTFGRFVADPFPARVARAFAVDHLNLGFAGAGPEYFLGHPELIARINGARLCVLQVMSGRSVSTPLLRAVDRGGVLEFTRGPLEGQKMLAALAYRELLAHYGEDAARRQVDDARESWREGYRRLLDAIEVPVVLLWVSTRRPAFDVDVSSAEKLLGPFPQLVDEASLESLRPRCLDVVDATFREERPHLLVNMASRRAEPVFSAEAFPNRREWSRTYNVYYPSPRMHDFVANTLIRAVYRSEGVREPLESARR